MTKFYKIVKYSIFPTSFKCYDLWDNVVNEKTRSFKNKKKYEYEYENGIQFLFDLKNWA